MDSDQPAASDNVSSATAAVAATPTVVVVIPTKDRPDFLEEAIDSAVKQTHAPSEIIVVDDGSAQPVQSAQLQKRHGPTVHVIRNERSFGLAYSRNRGVEAASAEYVVHLDDDDLLAANAIEQCISALAEFPEADVVFFAASGFGPRAEHFNRVQPEGVRRVIGLGLGIRARPDIVVFGPDLFTALLVTVPIAFQRVLSSRNAWQKVSKLRWRVYGLDPEIPNEEAAKTAITGPLRDSEWARYAALTCQHTILVDQPLYLQRCAGQGYSSLPSNQLTHMRQGLDILRHLMRGAECLPELGKWKTSIRGHLSDAYFDAAYQQYQAGKRFDALRLLRHAMSHCFKIKQLRLMIKLGLPGQIRAASQ
jgi:hypothetical protein